MNRPFIAATLLALAGAALAADLPPADGEIRRINTAGHEVTIKHGEIKNLDMPPMTMVFKVQDTKQLAGLKAGQKVRFTADQIQGELTVLTIAPAAP